MIRFDDDVPPGDRGPALRGASLRITTYNVDLALVSTHYSHLWCLRLDDDRDVQTETTKRGSGTFALDTLHTGTRLKPQRVHAPHRLNACSLHS